jgi:hypothetical protein
MASFIGGSSRMRVGIALAAEVIEATRALQAHVSDNAMQRVREGRNGDRIGW